MTDAARPNVVRDCKIMQAMDLAKAAGDDLAEKVRQGQDFVAAAAAAGFDTAETEPITRRGLAYDLTTRLTPIRHVPMSTAVLERFLDEAFKLPYAEQVDPLSDLKAITVLAFPHDESVFVVELVDHEPASGQDYVAGGQRTAMMILVQQRGRMSAEAWFDWDSIVRRTGYVVIDPGNDDKEDDETE